MSTNSARNSLTNSEAVAIAALRVNELKIIVDNRAALISTNVWDDVTRQIVGVVSADALIISQFAIAAPIGDPAGISTPATETRDRTVLSGPVTGDQDD